MEAVKIVEQALKDYKSKASTIETTDKRVEEYKKMKNDPEIEIILTSPVELGMPRSPNHGGSQTESIILRKDQAISKLEEWIRDEQSRIYPLKLEKEQIDGALGALNQKERFVIECKYFENMIWRDIEYSVNKKFEQQNFVTYETLKKDNKKAVALIGKILRPFYEKFGLVISKSWEETKTA
jgi:hypothetical protein